MDGSGEITIEVVTTGGTIDKSYDELEGTLTNRESMIRHYILRDLRLPYTNLRFHSLFSKDSLEITDDDRNQLAEFVVDLSKKMNPIVVIHGTDTLAKSAQRTLEVLDPPRVPVIFTGAMIPAGFVKSDALQNLTESIFAARVLDPWVYVCLHSAIHRAPNVSKDRSTLTFVSTQLAPPKDKK